MLLYAAFDQNTPALPGRQAYRQAEAPFWAGMHAFVRLLSADAVLAVLTRQPQLRQVLLTRAAAPPAGGSADDAQATAHAQMCATKVLQVSWHCSYCAAMCNTWRFEGFGMVQIHFDHSIKVCTCAFTM